MSVDAIQSIAMEEGAAVAAPSKLSKTPAEFSTWLKQEIEQVNQQIIDADTQVRKLAVGEATNLHQVMISLEKAKLSFELAMQVRNKLLEAYQDVMRMQI